MKILNGTPRPNVPSQKAWLEIASDNHSRIFTTLLPQTAFIDSNLFIVYTHTYSTTTLVCERGERKEKVIERINPTFPSSLLSSIVHLKKSTKILFLKVLLFLLFVLSFRP